uniref:LRRNT domain-containing protein n=1 Tax=Trichobilharzia regenti TaxID=157069 RepID=A0AA85IUZ8_TRIRE|nr:unnamed protein product [Trichobilharzia regenti]
MQISIILMIPLLLNIPLSFTQRNFPAVNNEPCPSMCKCSINPISENNSDSMFNMPGKIKSVHKDKKNNYFYYSILATCWITSDLISLDCTSKWSVLHLQILNDGKEYSGALKYPKNVQIQPSTDLFHKCKSIERLAIWENNQINYLPSSLFKPLIHLTRLIIQLPTLHRLPDHFLLFMPRLNFLMVSKSSQLTQISQKTFEPCPRHLKTIWLYGNGLGDSLTVGLFHACDLYELWLGENKLRWMPVGSLNGLTNLKHLRLNNNQLHGSLEEVFGVYVAGIRLPEDNESHSRQYSALSDVRMLKLLDLSYNKIKSIEGYQWSSLCSVENNEGLCYLEELRLEHNELVYLGPYAFNGLPRLRKLTLSDNTKLYTPESIMSLTLSLHSLSFSTNYLYEVLITVRSDTLEERDTTTTTLNICQPSLTDSRMLLHKMDKSLRSIILQINRHSCHKQGEWDRELSTQKTVYNVVSDQPLCVSNGHNTQVRDNIVSNESSSNHQSTVMSYVKQSTEMELASLFVGLICFGVILGSSVVLITWYFTKPRKSTRKQKFKNRQQKQNRISENFLPLSQITPNHNQPTHRNVLHTSNYIYPYHQMCYTPNFQSTGSSMISPLVNRNSCCQLPPNNLILQQTSNQKHSYNQSRGTSSSKIKFAQSLSKTSAVVSSPGRMMMMMTKQPDLLPLCSLPTMETSVISESVYSLVTQTSSTSKMK